MKKPNVTLREVIAELRSTRDIGLSPRQREWIADNVERLAAFLAEEKLRAPRKVRNTKAPQLVSLDQWEEKNGGLCLKMLDSWITEKILCRKQVQQLIEEFRTEMWAKNKQYSDFRAAFQVYLTKGYLSKTIDQVKAKPGESKRWGNVATTRGATL